MPTIRKKWERVFSPIFPSLHTKKEAPEWNLPFSRHCVCSASSQTCCSLSLIVRGKAMPQKKSAQNISSLYHNPDAYMYACLLVDNHLRDK
jgi:hypothetical protein